MTDSPKKAPGDSPVAAHKAADPPRILATKPVEAAADPAERVAAALRSITPASAPRADTRVNPLLEKLVYGDNDLVGLVAYAMHEVNRRDWRAAYETTHGRSPSEAEFNAYLVGEQLERRLETYRRLAEDAIAKVASGDQNLRRLAEGVPDLPRLTLPADAPAAPALVPGTRALQATLADKAVVPAAKKAELGKLALYLAFLMVAVAGLAYLLRYGMDVAPPPR